MKKLISILIALIYSSVNSAFALSELYYLKNIKTADVSPYVNTNLTSQGFSIVKQNPYYAVAQDGSDYVVIILQQSGDNMFYYYQSENNQRVNKNFLKDIKRQNIVYEQSFNQNIIDIYDNLAKNVIPSIGSIADRYSFEEPEQFFAPPKQNSVQNQYPATLQGYVAQLTAGTKIQAYLQNAINTSTAQKGDRVVAVVSNNLVYNGVTIAPQGSLIYGTLSKARNATYGSRNGRVVIDFNQIVTPENKIYNISTEEIDFAVSNEGKISDSAKKAVGSAAVGAVAGILFALLADRNVAQAAAIGAGVSAGTSIVKSTAERGVDAEIPSFTELELTLSKPLNVTVNY